MELERLRTPPDRSEIQSYGPGGFVVSGTRYRGSLLVFADRVESLAVAEVGELTPQALEAVTTEEVDLLLLGTGARFAVPPREVLAALRARGIAFEPMSTPAACRTFNLLLAEDRRVAALLLCLPER